MATSTSHQHSLRNSHKLLVKLIPRVLAPCELDEEAFQSALSYAGQFELEPTAEPIAEPTGQVIWTQRWQQHGDLQLPSDAFARCQGISVTFNCTGLCATWV